MIAQIWPLNVSKTSPSKVYEGYAISKATLASQTFSMKDTDA